jgi:hypothetical protein
MAAKWRSCDPEVDGCHQSFSSSGVCYSFTQRCIAERARCTSVRSSEIEPKLEQASAQGT